MTSKQGSPVMLAGEQNGITLLQRHFHAHVRKPEKARHSLDGDLEGQGEVEK